MVSRHQLRKAIEIIESASAEGFLEITQEIDSAIIKLKQELHLTDEKWKLLSQDIGKAQSVFGFDEKFFKSNTPHHSFTVQNFVKDWMEKQSDWRYPICFLSPSQPTYTEYCLKSSLVYVCSNNFKHSDIIDNVINKLDKTPTSVPNMFRLKQLNHIGLIDSNDVPFQQIGTVFSIDYFPYLSLKQLRNYFKSFCKILRPGGSAMLHITDADCEEEWKSVVGKKITYCNIEIVKDLCNQIGLEFCNYYHVDEMYTFFHIKQPGILKTNKKMPTKIEKVH